MTVPTNQLQMMGGQTLMMKYQGGPSSLEFQPHLLESFIPTGTAFSTGQGVGGGGSIFTPSH
jgi:hypothetical protein